MSVDEIRESVGADSLGYLSVEGMVEASGQKADDLCMACFTGSYPVKPPVEGVPIGTLPVSRMPSVYRRRHDAAPVRIDEVTRPDLAAGSPQPTSPSSASPASAASQGETR